VSAFGAKAHITDGSRASDVFLWGARAVLPLASQSAIFDKFNEFRHPQLTMKWFDLIYGRAAWLSLAKTQERRELAQEIGSMDGWVTLLSESTDKEDRRILSGLKAKSMYKETHSSHWQSEITKALFFTDLPAHLSHAASPAFPPTEKVARCVFFLVAAVFNCVSVLIQLAFPLVFLVMIFYIPLCY
jgi:hypothetical protein